MIKASPSPPPPQSALREATGSSLPIGVPPATMTELTLHLHAPSRALTITSRCSVQHSLAP